MKRIYIRLLVFTVAFAATIAVLYYNDNKDFYEAGKNGAYEVSVGETLTFKLRDPGSAMAQVWLNPVNGLEMTSHTFQPDLLDQGCEGCSGTGIYTFKAKKAGSYKILMGVCPPGKNCTDKDTQPSNIFSITVGN